MTSRRKFIQIVPLAGAAMLAGRSAFAADPPLVDPKDPLAASLGYVADATKADKAKFPKYAAGQHCGSCLLFQGKADAAAGPCPLFAGKYVAGAGWCSQWAKKA
jgi:High potential iron-sulfur protein